MKNLLIFKFIILVSFVAQGQSPNDVTVYNQSNCDAYVWLELFPQNSGPCDPDCNISLLTTSKVLLHAGDIYTFLGSGHTGAWGRIYFDGDLSLGEYDEMPSSGCGSNSPTNEECGYNGPHTMWISWVSCGTAVIDD